MKTFNLFNEIIVVRKSELIQAINGAKEFGITHDGRIVHTPFSHSDIFIYQGCINTEDILSLAPAKLLGKNYQLVEDNDRMLIKAAGAWQELISINMNHADYDDTSNDGIAEFSDSRLEDIGWHATEFNITYRTMVKVLEEECDGVLLCIEQEEPYQFSGLGFLTERERAEKILFKYCKAHADTALKNDEAFAPEQLSDDEKEAAKFFGLL